MKEQKEKVKLGVNKTWKVLAIVFITLFILESLGVVWLWNEGSKAIKHEDECAINICGGSLSSEYDAYQYDAYYDICYCYKDNELIFETYMGNWGG